MTIVRIVGDGIDLRMAYDPSDALDCEILAEAFLLLHRRNAKQPKKVTL